MGKDAGMSSHRSNTDPRRWGADRGPFDTADIRQRVLEACTASPARFREDANAEEDWSSAATGRLLIELADPLN